MFLAMMVAVSVAFSSLPILLLSFVQRQALAGCLQRFVQAVHNRLVQQGLFSTFGSIQLDDKVCQIADLLNLPIAFIIFAALTARQ